MNVTAIGSQPIPITSLRPDPGVSSEAARENAAGKPGKEPDLDKYEPSGEEPETEKCTANTDRVDAEIRRLKKEKELLQQQIRQADGDPERQARLEQKLSQIEMELSQKDNDAYRRQHAVFTNH